MTDQPTNRPRGSHLNAAYLNRCITALESAYQQMENKTSSDDSSYEIYHAACVKEFEIILEQCGKLLRKKLRSWFSSHEAVDRLTFKDVFRYAAKHGLMNIECVNRWMKYRESRNATAHDYGEGFAEKTVRLLPEFIADAKQVVEIVQRGEEEGQ